MRKYLSTLHTRTDSHKKRFAFLVSGGFTLIVFTLWSLATFGTGGTLAQDDRKPTTDSAQQEVSPFASLREGVATGFLGISEAFGGLFGGVKGAFDFQPDNADTGNPLNRYGR